MEVWQIIQACKLPAGLYDRNKFVALIEQLYDTNKNAWVTDQKDLIESHPKEFWQLE